MSRVKIEYEVLVCGLYPFKGEFEKEGFKIVENKLNLDLFDILYKEGVIYLSPLFPYSCYTTENGITCYLTLKKTDIIDIDYKEYEEYDKKFTSEYLYKLDLFQYVEDFEKKIILEINNDIKFPVTIIKAYNQNEEEIAKLGNFMRLNLPSLIGNDLKKIKEVITRQNNRLNSGFDFEKIQELINKNKYFKNSLEMYYSSFSVSDHHVGYALLITSLESLLSAATYSIPKHCEKCGQPMYKIRSSVSDNTSAILMDTDGTIGKEIKRLYDKRSSFIHNGNRCISKEDELTMQEYVRKILLMYWYVSLVKQTMDHKQIIREIQSPNYKHNIMYSTFLIGLKNLSYTEKYKEIFDLATCKIL